MDSLSESRDPPLLGLTRAGRQRARRIREVNTDAVVAAARIELASLVARIGAYHLSLAGLTQQQTTTTQPGLTEHAQVLLESLAAVVRHEIEQFRQRTEMC